MRPADDRVPEISGDKQFATGLGEARWIMLNQTEPTTADEDRRLRAARSGATVGGVGLGHQERELLS